MILILKVRLKKVKSSIYILGIFTVLIRKNIESKTS